MPANTSQATVTGPARSALPKRLCGLARQGLFLGHASHIGVVQVGFTRVPAPLAHAASPSMPELVQPLPLWPHCAHGADGKSLPPPATQPGHFVRIASMMPAPSLAPATVALSVSLADGLGRPAIGSSILLYQVGLASMIRSYLVGLILSLRQQVDQDCLHDCKGTHMDVLLGCV